MANTAVQIRRQSRVCLVSEYTLRAEGVTHLNNVELSPKPSARLRMASFDPAP
jgi:hypothetical protein